MANPRTNTEAYWAPVPSRFDECKLLEEIAPILAGLRKAVTTLKKAQKAKTQDKNSTIAEMKCRLLEPLMTEIDKSILEFNRTKNSEHELADVKMLMGKMYHALKAMTVDESKWLSMPRDIDKKELKEVGTFWAVATPLAFVAYAGTLFAPPVAAAAGVSALVVGGLNWMNTDTNSDTLITKLRESLTKLEKTIAIQESVCEKTENNEYSPQ